MEGEKTEPNYMSPKKQGEGIMKKSKIALKPYLNTIAGFCDTLSNEELKVSYAPPLPGGFSARKHGTARE
jgi:hypothetical protein